MDMNSSKHSCNGTLHVGHKVNICCSVVVVPVLLLPSFGAPLIVAIVTDELKQMKTLLLTTEYSGPSTHDHPCILVVAIVQ